MQGIRPEKLTPRELLHYAYLQKNANGLPKEWVDALLIVLQKLLDAR